MKTLFLFGLIILSIFVLSTNDAVAQWSEIPQMQYIPVTCILVISDSTLFVGGHQHSLYRSTDGGETWINVAGEITADTIQSLNSAGKYIFAGTNAGVYRSSDIGETWETFNTGFIWGSTSINQLANVDSILYAATNAGVYRSTDFGTSWIATNTGLAIGQGHFMTYTIPALGLVSTPAGLFATQDLLGGAHVLHPGDSTWRYVGLGSHWCDAGALIVLDTAIFAGADDGVFLVQRTRYDMAVAAQGASGSFAILHVCGGRQPSLCLYWEPGILRNVQFWRDMGSRRQLCFRRRRGEQRCGQQEISLCRDGERCVADSACRHFNVRE